MTDREKLIEQACFKVNPNVKPDTLTYAKAVGREMAATYEAMLAARASDPPLKGWREPDCPDDLLPQEGLVERVARALYREAQLEAFKLGAPNDVPDFDNDDEDSRAFYRRMARAAVAALQDKGPQRSEGDEG